MKLSRGKTIVYSLLPLCFLFAIAEGAARIHEHFAPPMVVDRGLGFTPDSRVFVVDPADTAYLITAPEKTANFVPQRFAHSKPDNTYRVFFVGESSVNFLHSVLPLLKIRLNAALSGASAEIINCGGLSYGSHRLRLVLAEIMNYEPDLIMLYIGHNEFEEIEQLRYASLDSLWAQRLLDKTAVTRLLRDRLALATRDAMQREHNRTLLENHDPNVHIGRAWGHEWKQEELDERMLQFEDNLTAMLQLCADQGVPLIMASIPSNYLEPKLAPSDAWRWKEAAELYAAGKLPEGYARAKLILQNLPRHQASPRENAILHDVAAAGQVPIVDVWGAVEMNEPHGVPGETLFYDECHLRLKGNLILLYLFGEAAAAQQ